MKFLYAILLFLIAQIMAWFQSNSGIIGEPFKSNYVAIALVLGPLVSLLFAYSTIFNVRNSPLFGRLGLLRLLSAI